MEFGLGQLTRTVQATFRAFPLMAQPLTRAAYDVCGPPRWITGLVLLLDQLGEAVQHDHDVGAVSH